MKITILLVGDIKGPLAEVAADYLKRAGFYWRIQVVEVASGVKRGDRSPQAVRDAEGERVLARLPDEGEVVLLTRDGRSMGSRDIAAYLEKQAVQSTPEVVFVVGGAFGHGQAVVARATREISLSAMTLPHDLARVVLLEQIYRAGTIIRNEPYHKQGRDV